MWVDGDIVRAPAERPTTEKKNPKPNSNTRKKTGCINFRFPQRSIKSYYVCLHNIGIYRQTKKIAGSGVGNDDVDDVQGF
jgi:hypothetical protein